MKLRIYALVKECSNYRNNLGAVVVNAMVTYCEYFDFLNFLTKE